MTEGEVDPSPSECTKEKPYKEAQMHDGAELVKTVFHKTGETDEHYRCTFCGREWVV